VVKTGNYTIVSTDAGNIIAFNYSSACTATLSSASSLGSMFTVRLLSYGVGTVTISSSSTINGGTTLLKGGSALISSDGSALYSGTTKSYVANASNGTSDSINNAAPGTSFTTTLALPANLPVGTRVHVMHSGKYTLTAGSVNSELAVRDGAGVEYCSGEQIKIYNSNGNSGNGKWMADCWLTVQTTGASGNIYGVNHSVQWTADGVTINGITAGNAQYPGYDTTGLRQSNDSQTGVTFNDTTSKTLHVEERQTTNSSLTLWLNQFTIEIFLP
jgi:hypothetical protein